MHSSLVIHQLGIQQWYPRKLQHPWYQDKRMVTVEPAIFQAKCMVLLPAYVNQDFQLVAAANKILTGMLGVLNLPNTAISIARIHSNNISRFEQVTNRQLTSADWQQALAEVNSLQPEFILLLAKPDNFSIADKCISISFNPLHLASNPQDKSSAYQDLLTLKEKLHYDANIT